MKGKANVTYDRDEDYGTITKIVNGVPISFIKITDRKG